MCSCLPSSGTLSLLSPRCHLANLFKLFYNTPTSDPLYQSLDFFVHVSETIKDACGVAWCTGSGYVIRRSALDEIGQIPTGSVAEDVLTSTLLLGMGWKTTYVHEPLQFGTVPDSYGSHIKQRTRWVNTAISSQRIDHTNHDPDRRYYANRFPPSFLFLRP